MNLVAKFGIPLTAALLLLMGCVYYLVITQSNEDPCSVFGTQPLVMSEMSSCAKRVLLDFYKKECNTTTGVGCSKPVNANNDSTERAINGSEPIDPIAKAESDAYAASGAVRDTPRSSLLNTSQPVSDPNQGVGTPQPARVARDESSQGSDAAGTDGDAPREGRPEEPRPVKGRVKGAEHVANVSRPHAPLTQSQLAGSLLPGVPWQARQQGRKRSPELNFSIVGESVRRHWIEWADNYIDEPFEPQGVWKTLPPIALWLRCFTPGADKLLTVFFESYEMFWPKGYGELVVVLDDESPPDHEFGKVLSQVPPYPQVTFMREPDWNIFPNQICGRSRGYDRQMYSGFYADQFTDAELIALVDNDSLFVTMVEPTQLFDERGVPRVIGKHTRYNDDGKVMQSGLDSGRWAEATERALGKRQIADFMWNFPVVIRREAFRAVREYISRLHNKSFEDAFRYIAETKTSYCQINIILNYEFYFNHDRYKWHIQSLTGDSGIWSNGTYNIPLARPATHARGMKSTDIYAHVREGYCYSCTAMGNCVNPIDHDIIRYHHYILFSWSKTPHLWNEKGVKSQQAAQAEHYEVSLPKYKRGWTANLKFILSHNSSYYTDCSVPPDYKDCHDYNKEMHRKHQQKVMKNLRIRHPIFESCVSSFKTLVPLSEIVG